MAADQEDDAKIAGAGTDPAEPAAAPETSSDAAQVAQLTLDLEQTKAAYQRLAADFENYKRRKAQESQDLARYGSAALLRAILPALDNLSRAVAHLDADVSSGVSEGLRLTLRQLEEALASQGVERIAAVGRPFDPRLHEAVTTVPAAGVARDTVVDELLPGYQIHDRVVRPAQVSVAQPEASPAPSVEGQGSPPDVASEPSPQPDPETIA